MQTSEAVEVVSSLLNELRRKMLQRGSLPPAAVVLNEYPELHDLLGTIEGFLSDKNILPYIRDLEKVRRQLRVARWLHEHYKNMAQNNRLASRTYTNYQEFTGTLQATIEDRLQDTTTLINARQPSFLQTAYKNVAMLILGLAAAYATPAFAQETTLARTEPNPYATTETKTNTQRDYVKELQERVDKIQIETNKPWHFYNNKATELTSKNPDEALRYSAKAVELEPSRDAPYTNVAMAYFFKANSLPQDGRHDEESEQYLTAALRYAVKGLELFNKNKLPQLSNEKAAPLLANKYEGIGAIYMRLKNKEKANEYASRALTIKDSLTTRQLLNEIKKLK